MGRKDGPYRESQNFNTVRVRTDLINRKWCTSLKDVRVCRGADVNSDHYLVTAKIKLKLRKVKPQGQRRRQLDISKLKWPQTNKAFTLELRNRFGALDADPTDPTARARGRIPETS